MKRPHVKTMLAALAAVAALAGCGGGSGDAPVAATPPDARPELSRSAQATADFVDRLMARDDEASDPIDVDGLVLADDSTAEPARW